MAEKIIEVKPYRGGWQVFEMEGVAPWFGNQEQAVGYAKTRCGFGAGEIRILDAAGNVTESIKFDQRDRNL